MDAQIVWTIVCGLAIAVGAVGVIVPVLPGSLLIAASLLVWAIVVGGPLGWIIFGIGVVFVASGMASSAVLTGKAMKERSIPGRSVVIGLLLGVVGFFVVPVVGLLLGFAVGLFLSEYARQRSSSPLCRRLSLPLRPPVWEYWRSSGSLRSQQERGSLAC